MSGASAALPESARGIAKAVRSGTAQAGDVLQRTLHRIAGADDQVQAFVEVFEDEQPPLVGAGLGEKGRDAGAVPGARRTPGSAGDVAAC